MLFKIGSVKSKINLFASQIMKCPHCKLINPPEAQRCDCGFDFATKKLEKSYMGAPPQSGDRAAGNRDIAFGAFFLAAGAIATGITYSLAAENGGAYTVTVGLFVAGTYRLVRGCLRSK